MRLLNDARQPEVVRQAQWLKGCAIFLCSLVAFACLDALAKDLVGRYSAPLVNIARYSVIIVLAWFMMWVKRVPIYVGPAERNLLILRGAMLGSVSICFMAALQYLPLAEGTALYFVSPLIVVLLAPMVLRENVGIKQYAAVVLGLVGMLLIVNPLGDASTAQSAGDTGISVLGSLLMLAAATGYALVQLLTRKLAYRVQSEQMFAYSALLCWMLGFVALIVWWPTTWPNARDTVEMILMGVSGGMGQFLLIYAFKTVPASTLAPFNYFQLVLAVIFGELFFAQRPSLLSLTGIALIVLAGLSLTVPMLLAYFRAKRA
jgi:drug/metabolite transporter (DMT)-like permease